MSIVCHFGPDPVTVGGMASVIKVLTEHDVGGDKVDACPTWKPQSPVATARLVASSVKALLRMPAGQVAHMHLSERGSFVREGALILLAQRRGLVTVATIHGASFIPFAQSHPRLVSTVLRSADLITCIDPETFDFVRSSTPHVRCELIPNPVFVDSVFLPADQTDELVVFAGEICLRKGADILHSAWQLLAKRRPTARCLMVGPVTDFVPPGAERLEVRRPVDSIEMREIVRLARVIALPSRAEAAPMILTEAMSQGRPFVSTPVGGIAELASEGGMLVPVEDEAGLADRLAELLANPGLARAIGERGRQFCLETRNVEVIDARLRELYSAAAVDGNRHGSGRNGRA